MKVVQTIAELRSERAKLGTLALVPTMGALHAGHLSLVEIARKKAEHTAVSIFVNPTQFGAREDYGRYPRPIATDLEKCEAAGVELVFHPSEQEMYPPGAIETIVDFPSLTTVLEGKHRPGHFRGVCQIVAKLFNIFDPQFACFGQKDFQQLRVLGAMVEMLNWDIRIVSCPTVRDPDGMAMSSRNQYLQPAERERAVSISKALFAAQEMVRNGVKQASRLSTAVQHQLLARHLQIDYIASVDPVQLKPVEIMTGPTVIAVAARIGSVRLIDNVIVEPKDEQMYPIIFHVPFFHWPIYGYGLIMVCAFLATQWLSARLAKGRGIDPEIFINATLFALLAGVAGARLSSVLENLSEYTKPELSIWQNFFNMINIRSGGLTFYGGVILACPIVIGYFIHKKVPVKLALDICAPCLMLGLGIGRIGCFLSGCCYGATTTVPWAIHFPYGSDAYTEQFYNREYDLGVEKLDHPVPEQLVVRNGNRVRLLTPEELAADPGLAALAASEKSNAVHPTQFYSTFNSLLIMGILLIYFSLPHTPGRVLALMFMLEGPTRFMLELLRVEPPVIANMSLSMVLGLVLLGVGVILWFAFRPGKENSRREWATA